MVTSIANTDYLALFPTDESIHIRRFLTKPIAPAELLRNMQSCCPFLPDPHLPNAGNY